jgi:predicted nucleotidyltransferase component of viral defense system
MTPTVVEQMLERYPRDTDAAVTHALREVMQEIALAGLNRGGFFAKAAFYGGTCLRIFYGLPRFSEDLDFSLLAANLEFTFEPYFKALREEFAAFGFEVDIVEKSKSATSDIASAFLKKSSSIYDLKVSGGKTLKIKLEVDIDPPLGFGTEQKLLIQPYSFYVNCFTLPDLFAGKVHAVLFRKWKNRANGRDWFDFEWYVRRGTPLNLRHLAERARQSGHWQGDDMSPQQFMELLRGRILSLDVDSLRLEVSRFVREADQLQIWSRDYFIQLAGLITNR